MERERKKVAGPFVGLQFVCKQLAQINSSETFKTSMKLGQFL